jgi:hydrogenase maturation protease
MVIKVIGVGNEYRRDDGVGLAVARELRRFGMPVDILEHSGEGAGLMQTWEDADAVVLVDAVLCGGKPGALFRLDAHTDRLSAGSLRCSNHAFGVADAIALGRVLHKLPRTFILYGIEGEDYGEGEGCSNSLQAAIPEAAERIAGEIEKLLANGSG